jgi:hypothetical protein
VPEFVDEEANLRDTSRLLDECEAYRGSRLRLLDAIGVPDSNRDPLAEFAEVITCSVLQGRMAESRTQKGWDVRTSEGERVQVRYLANRTGDWQNWHWVASDKKRWDWYALVVYEDLSPTTIHMFPSADLTPICSALEKRHEDQAMYLRFTWGNHRAIRENPARFEALGMRFFNLESLSG